MWIFGLFSLTVRRPITTISIPCSSPGSAKHFARPIPLTLPGLVAVGKESARGMQNMRASSGTRKQISVTLCHLNKQFQIACVSGTVFFQKSYCSQFVCVPTHSLLAHVKNFPGNETMSQFPKDSYFSLLAKQLNLTCLSLQISGGEINFTCKQTSISDCRCKEMHALTFPCWESEHGCQLLALANSLDTSGFW